MRSPGKILLAGVLLVRASFGLAQEFPWDEKPGVESSESRSQSERELGLDPDGNSQPELREILSLQGELLNSLQSMYGILRQALAEAQTPHQRPSPEELAAKAQRVGLYNRQVALLVQQLPKVEVLRARLGPETSSEARSTIHRLEEAIEKSQAIVEETYAQLAAVYAKQGTPLEPLPQVPETSPTDSSASQVLPESAAEVQAWIEAGRIESSIHLLEVFQRIPEARLPKASLADFRRLPKQRAR